MPYPQLPKLGMKKFVQSNTNVDNSNEANVAAMLTGIILALTGVGAVIAIAVQQQFNLLQIM